MPDVEIRGADNSIKGTLRLPDAVFGMSRREDILHTSVINYLANQRQGTHATKTRGLVSGGGKKPWRQKHTGRARAGSIRSPLWRKGGTIFGPQPRDYSYQLPKNFRRRALAEALSAKLSDGEITIVDAISLDKPRTKSIVRLLESLGFTGKSVLLVLPEKDETVLLSSRNIPGVEVARVRDLNPYQILTHEKIVMTQDSVRALGEGEGQ